MARPTIFTKNVLQKLERAFAMDCTDEEASLYADISPSSLYNYQKINPEFLERKRVLRQTPVLKARQSIIKSLDNPSFAFKYLERKRKQEFGNQISIVSDGPKIFELSKERKAIIDNIIRENI